MKIHNQRLVPLSEAMKEMGLTVRQALKLGVDGTLCFCVKIDLGQIAVVTAIDDINSADDKWDKYQRERNRLFSPQKILGTLSDDYVGLGKGSCEDLYSRHVCFVSHFIPIPGLRQSAECLSMIKGEATIYAISLVNDGVDFPCKNGLLGHGRKITLEIKEADLFICASEIDNFVRSDSPLLLPMAVNGFIESPAVDSASESIKFDKNLEVNDLKVEINAAEKNEKPKKRKAGRGRNGVTLFYDIVLRDVFGGVAPHKVVFLEEVSDEKYIGEYAECLIKKERKMYWVRRYGASKKFDIDMESINSYYSGLEKLSRSSAGE